MTVSEKMLQGSEEWLQIRKGRATASEFSKILTATGKLSAQSLGYMRKLARECVLDDPQEFAGNKYTDWGNDHEPLARELFVELTGLDVEEVGFCISENNPVLGCSPDGLIKTNGEFSEGLEIKCPQVDTHVGYLLANELPAAYKLQVHGSMAVTGLNVWHFMSYFPGLNPLILKVERDEFTEKLSEALDDFVIKYQPERDKVLKAILPEGEEAA